MKKKWNDGWFFYRGKIEDDMTSVLNGKEKFIPVRLPHDYLIGDLTRLYEDSSGFYYKEFSVQKTDAGRWFVTFDGVYMDSTVYLNGVQIFEWKYGYSSFTVDLTSHLRNGQNEIAVRCNYQCPNSRWYSGAGIYRNVWLHECGEYYLVEDGVYVHTRKADKGYELTVSTEVGSKGEAVPENEKNVRICHCLKEAAGNTDLIYTIKEKETNILPDVLEWDFEHPVLYELETRLYVDDRLQDQQVCRIGFKEVVLTPDRGAFLNGHPFKIHGVCEHHDLGALGAAVSETAIRRRLYALKEMGVNAIRGAHNMMAPEYLDQMDEMGFLFISEGFDMWRRPKNPFDYARFFEDWHRKDIASWIRRDRNHVCVFMWSIGNEIYDTHVDASAAALTGELMQEVYRHDRERNAPVTIGSNYMAWDGARKCAEVYKLAGFNYGEKLYEEAHREHPDWMIYGSETSSIVQSRGIYHFPLSASVLCEEDLQCSSLGNSQTSWGAASYEACVCVDRDIPYSLGQFIWSGHDYIGEPTPYQTKNSYFGVIDTAGFPKDFYYVWQAAWRSVEEYPMVHIWPYWDFNEGQEIDVRICSNAPYVELFVNGRSYGKQKLDNAPGSGQHIIADYCVNYERGEIKAVAYNEAGEILACESRHSFGDTQNIRIKYCEEGKELLFAEISATDEAGNPVENARDLLRVSVQGDGELVGLDNGDSTDYDSYQSDTRCLFGGRMTAIVRKMREDAKVTLTAERVGRKRIRNILLESQDGLWLNPAQRTARVHAAACPPDHAYPNIRFSVVNEKGVKSSLATLETEGSDVTVTAKGDGEFYLCAVADNGKDYAQVMSKLKFRVQGLGTCYEDPYDFISGSSYVSATGEVSNGNEKGVATAREAETTVTFDNLDFGETGSDTITIPIFALSDDAYRIEIYKGAPAEEDFELLGEFIYQKKSRWNVYQEDTFRLKRRVKGIAKLTIKTFHKVHIKGFSFARMEKAYTKLWAAEADTLYGDHYEMAGERVERIGNNVTLQFTDMNFEKGVKELTITGRCQRSNTIHVRFVNAQGEVRQIVEFPESGEYLSRTFEMEPVQGVYDVNFVFLPGSEFDLESFQFQS